jgi:hypothetical protein
MAKSIQGTCHLARARGNAIVLDAIMPAFVSRKCLSVQLLAPFTTSCRRNNPANISMQEKRRLARHHQHKAFLVEQELLLDNTVIPDAPPTPQPATPPPPGSPSLPPLRLIARFAAWALGISSLQNQHCSLPWSAPQVLHPPKAGKTGHPRIIKINNNLISIPDAAHSTEQRPDPTQLQ